MHMPPKYKCCQNAEVTKTQMLSNCKCHQTQISQKIQISTKNKRHQKKMSPGRKCH